MSIWQKAYETYENHAHLAGVEVAGQQTLTPIGHIVQKTQIEIVLRADGSFHHALAVDQKGDDCKCIIPATEASASRTNGKTPCPHPLCEQLGYLIQGEEVNCAYVAQLASWAHSPYTTPKVNAILSYVKGGSILKDLAKEQVIVLESDGTLAAKKIAGVEYIKCMVRWRVYQEGTETATWKDKELFNAYQQFLKATQRLTQGLCMISGQESPLASPNAYPKGILSKPYTAKLISANDNKYGFTYRGRFTSAEETVSIGYLESQKINNILQWLCANQGGIKGGRTFLCWNPKGKPVFKVFNPFAPAQSTPATEPSDYRAQLQKTLAGLKNDLPDDEDVVIAAFEAATTGRLSITHYSERKASDFHQRINHWLETSAMPDVRKEIHPPALERIVQCAYGVERGKWLDVDDRVLREHMQRLLCCMTEGAAVPSALVKALCDKASRPLCCKEWNNRALVQFTACAMLRKYLNDLANKEEWTMILDEKQTDRSYLYGRMLAIFEYVERSTYSSSESREPNAIRMQTVFAQRPLHAQKVLEERLEPYYKKLSPGMRIRCRNKLGEIHGLFRQEDWGHMDAPLDGKYLLGYYHQRNDLYTSKKDNAESEEE